MADADRERLIDLMIEAKRTEPETGSFTDYLADYLLEHGVNEDCTKLKDQPTADMVEVRRGKWIETQEPLGWRDVDCAECSACHESWIIDEDSSIDDYECTWHYCPHCGAKMDGGNNYD